MSQYYDEHPEYDNLKQEFLKNKKTEIAMTDEEIKQSLSQLKQSKQ